MAMNLVLDALRYLRPTLRWQQRCTRCGATKGVATTRLFRLALPFPVILVGWCHTCRGVRMVAMEPDAGRHTSPGHPERKYR
jgi:hypothetical protein